EGMMVPADCRLIDDMNLAVLESHVSGQDGSVWKDSSYLARSGMEAICRNSIYAGSIVTSGHASAIVCKTGKDTLTRRMRINDNANLPEIMKYVKSLGGYISIASIIVSFLLLVVGVAAGADITDWFIVSIAIGASSLCDSMVSLCSSSLAFGAKKMAEDGMVVKNYSRIETLAKTNTIMCGKNLAFPPKRISLTGLYFSVRNYDRNKRNIIRMQVLRNAQTSFGIVVAPLAGIILNYISQVSSFHIKRHALLELLFVAPHKTCQSVVLMFHRQ
ncbi:MAG: cation-transporting P-type ATPase, partial [Bacteroidaceae bacterium]|nr:cation-transporting P-type ATPase [Bacteroidaceae bacterium]